MVTEAASLASRTGTVASRGGTWHIEDMAPPSPKAGGMPIALGVLAGSVSGAVAGYPVHGALAGLTAGAAAALLIWRIDRRR